MTVKQHINHGANVTICHLQISFFIPLNCVTLSQFYSITSLELFTKNNELWNERNEDFCIYGCLIVSRYIKGGRKLCL